MRTLILAIAVALTLSHAHAETTKRGLTQSDVVKVIADLFPEYCGRGDRCGYHFKTSGEGQSVCPFELWIEMSEAARIAGWPRWVWVGLDERKQPIAVASHKKYGGNLCADPE